MTSTIRAIAAPISTQGYDPEWRTAVKGFEKVAFNSAKRITDFVPWLYKPKTFTAKKILYPVYAGIGDAEPWDGMSPINPKGISYLYDVKAEQFTFANSVEYTYESELWDLYGMNTHKAEELGKSGPSKYQKLAADPFNSGFSVNWFDTVPLFSDSHPLVGTTNTQSNRVVGALSHDTLNDALIMGMTMIDPLGRPVEQEPELLIVHTTKVPLAEALLNKGIDKASGTLNPNDKNPYAKYKGLQVLGYPYIGKDMWFLKFSNAEAYVSNRVPIKLFPSRENPSHGMKQDMTFTTAFWFENYVQWIGSTGPAS